jgi:hypothetical protein
MPSASVSIATMVTPGCFTSIRTAYRMSCSSACIQNLHRRNSRESREIAGASDRARSTVPCAAASMKPSIQTLATLRPDSRAARI